LIVPPVNPQLSLENGENGDRSSARRRFIAWRQQITPDLRAQSDALLCESVWRLLHTLIAQSGTVVIGAYWPIQAEPDLRPLYDRIWQLGAQADWQLALPKVIGKDQPLVFGRLLRGGALRLAGFGVQIPEPFVAIEPDLLIIPCVAFRADGYRLGYGGGYFDRTLAQRSLADGTLADHFRADAPPAARGLRTIGVAYDECEWPDYQPQAHDRKLDWLVTPSQTLTSVVPAASCARETR
jgi:5-formyltetrahydrofolate cyclo-ligase